MAKMIDKLIVEVGTKVTTGDTPRSIEELALSVKQINGVTAVEKQYSVGDTTVKERIEF